jgi:hypothetical protein
MSETNLLRYLIEVIGEECFIETITTAKSKGCNGFISNPFLIFLIKTTDVSNGVLTLRSKIIVNEASYNYFKLTCVLFRDLKSELESNKQYLAETIRRVFSSSYGAFLSAFNELIAAGYCKSIGLSVVFNSSVQDGRADLLITSSQFGSFALDAKIVPNDRFLIDQTIHQLKSELIDAFSSLPKQNIWITLRTVDIKKIRKDLKLISNQSRGHYESDNIFVLFNSCAISNADLTIQIESCKIYLQLNYDYGNVLDQIKEKVEKAIGQAKVLGLRAIPWFMVPLDADRYGIEIKVIRMCGEMFPFYMSKMEDVALIPFYTLGFDEKQVSVFFDVLQVGSNRLGINQDTFSKYILSCIQHY